jgi:TRAP-type C4-dicarboxylate transport system permease small subunit
MKLFVMICGKIGSYMNAIAGSLLFFMMMLVVTDVVGRFFGMPVTGSYELVALAGAIVIGFAIPRTSLDHGHVSLDLLIERSSEVTRKTLILSTRVLSILLFIGLACFLVLKGHYLYINREVSSTLRIPQFILVYVLAFCCLIECLALTADIFSVINGGDQNE